MEIFFYLFIFLALGSENPFVLKFNFLNFSSIWNVFILNLRIYTGDILLFISVE